MDSKKKNEQLDITAMLDQAEVHYQNIAKLLGGYYADLVKAGVPSELASELVKQAHLTLMGAAKK